MKQASAEVFLVAGERSGDAYGGLLIQRLRAFDSEIRFVGLGGSRMAAAGMERPFSDRGAPIMGWTRVLKGLPRFRKLLSEVEHFIIFRNFGTVILIDYPGFNLRLAKRLKKRRPGIRIVYFVLPQVWAWGAWRVKTVGLVTDRRFSILPFESAFYRKNNIHVEYFGHPISEALDVPESKAAVPNPTNLRLAVLPGSRPQEVAGLLPVVIDALNLLSRDLKGHILLSAVDEVPKELYLKQIARYAGSMNLDLSREPAEELLLSSNVAIVKSGTGTLQAALTGTPHVVVYRAGVVDYLLARAFVDVAQISLVNLIAGTSIVTELIQEQLSARRLASEVLDLTFNAARRRRMCGAFEEIRKKLSGRDVIGRISKEILTEIPGGRCATEVIQKGVTDGTKVHRA